MNDNYMARTASEEVPIPGETPHVGEESTKSTSSNKTQRDIVSVTQKTQNSAEAEVENKNTEQEEEEETFTPQYIACQGAICRCNQGSSMPTLQVNTHRKYYVNDRGNNKLVATVKDLLFNPIAAPFGSCSVDNGRPCTYSAQEWKVPHTTDFPKVDGLDVLTEKGKLQCVSKQGEITLITHGQTQHIDQTETEEVTTALATLDHVNTLLRFDRLHDIDEDTYVSQVTSLTLNNLATLCASFQGGSTNRALIVLKGEELQFTAQTPPNETGKYISWSISEALGDSKVLEDGKKGTTFSTVITIDNGIYQQNQTTSRYFGMTALHPGTYVVSAASKEKNDPSKCFFGGFYYYIQVVDRATLQAIMLSNADKHLVIGDELTITVRSDIPINSSRLERMTIRVIVDGIVDNDAVVYQSKGNHAFKQEGNQLIALFKTTNANAYKVEVYEGEALSELGAAQFEVRSNAVISLIPSVDKVREGSEGEFSAVLKRGSKVDLNQVRWKLQNPQGTYEQVGVGGTKYFRFSQVGNYTIICSYAKGLFTSEDFKHTVTVVKNELESIRIEERIKPPAGDIPNGVYLNDSFTVSVTTLIPYKKPQQENSYVKQINKTEDMLDRFARFVGLKKDYVVQEQLDKNVDPEIIWTITYSKGEKKESGLTMQYGAITPEASPSSDTTETTAGEELAPIFIGLTSIKSLTNQVMICSNTPAITLAFNVTGTYEIVAMMNGKQIKYTVACVPGRIERWEFVDSDDNHIEYLSYNEDFHTTAQIKGYENKSAKIYYWFGPKAHQRVLLAKDYVDFNEEGVFTHTVYSNGEFWKNYHSKVGSAQENLVHFTIEQKVGVYNASVHKTSRKEKEDYNKGAKDPIKQRITTIFSTDMPQVFGKICRHFTYEAYFKSQGQRLLKHIKYGEAVAIYIRLIRGREDYAQTLEAVSLQVRVLENTKQEWGKRVDRQVELIEVSEADRKQKTISLALDTTKQLYREKEHKEEIGNPVLPRLIYFTVEYTHRLQGRDQSKAKKIKDALIFPYRYEMHGDNDAMLTELLDPTADEATLHKNIDLLEQLKRSGKAERYFDQLKLVETLAFEDAFKAITRAVRVARTPDKSTNDTDSADCPNCKKPVTVEDLKQLFRTQNIKVSSDERLLEEIAAYYTKYMDKVGMNTCYDKAYFFAVMLVEAGFIHKWKNEITKSIDKKESLNYYKGDGTLNQFQAFKNYPKMKEKLGRAIKDASDPNYKSLSVEEQVRLANFVYASSANKAKAKELCNMVIPLSFTNGVVDDAGMALLADENGEGWKYRGRGYFQLTGKDVYTKINTWIKELINANIDIVNNPDLVGSNVEIAVLSSMLFYSRYKKLTVYSKHLYSKKVFSGVGRDIKMIDRQGIETTNHALKNKVFSTKETIKEVEFPSTSEVFKVSMCLTFKELREYFDIVTYHIYANGEIHKKIPKEDKHPTKVKYLYYDKNKQKYELGVYEWIEIDELKSPTNASVEEGYSDTYIYPNDKGIDGDTAYYYRDSSSNLEQIITKSKKVGDKIIKILKYRANGKKTKLVKLEEPWEKGVKNTTVYFRYVFKETVRTYCGLDQYAVFAGAFFELNLITEGTGIASKDGTGFPSKTHVNGQSLDVDYFNPKTETTKLMEAMKKFGCTTFYVGQPHEDAAFTKLVEYGKSIQVKISSIAGHGSHIHCGPINTSHIIEVKDE
ncbi:PAAR-like protein [Myroides sp. DW712]|uniref:PAAR-like protein n=1 Tax=Myroides sp. DW712 TaxID=3389800 RepID=UPI003979339B